MRQLFPGFHGGSTAVGLLAPRLVAGIALMIHGYPKIQNPFGWMGPQAPVPGVLQAAAAIAEFGGGLCWILGLLTPVASILILITMLTAAFLGHISRGDPFVGKAGSPSWELAANYFAISVLLLLSGPGRLSVDALLFGRLKTGVTT